jgi:hypothetical protein
MKLLVKNSLPITFITCLLLLGSCGKKENTVNSSSGLGISSTSPIFSSPSGSSIYGQYQSVRSTVACLPGRNRLATDVSFYVNGGSVSGTTIGGNWIPGVLPGGTATAMYVGVSAFRDLMFLTKVTNGSQVVGYNVILSFCEVPNAYPNYPALVSNDRPLINFQAPQGITINTAVSCGYGLIAAALNTVIISQRSTTNPYTSDYPIYTSFTRPNCQ